MSIHETFSEPFYQSQDQPERMKPREYPKTNADSSPNFAAYSDQGDYEAARDYWQAEQRRQPGYDWRQDPDAIADLRRKAVTDSGAYQLLINNGFEVEKR